MKSKILIRILIILILIFIFCVALQFFNQPSIKVIEIPPTYLKGVVIP